MSKKPHKSQNPTPSGRRPGSSRSHRRTACLVVAVILLLAGGVMHFISSDASAKVVASACFRIGLVLGSLWLAWDSLRKPASWLPPGLAAAGVLGLAVVAAQPRMLFVLLPAAGILITIGGLVRAFRK